MQIILSLFYDEAITFMGIYVLEIRVKNCDELKPFDSYWTVYFQRLHPFQYVYNI